MLSCARVENMLSLTVWGAVLVIAIAILGGVWWLHRPRRVVIRNATTPLVNLDDPMEREAFVAMIRRTFG